MLRTIPVAIALASLALAPSYAAAAQHPSRSAAPAPGTPDPEAEAKIGEYFARIQASPLHQRVKAAGGKYAGVRLIPSASLHPDLAALMKVSEDVVLIHVVRNSCQLSTSGEDIVTMYDAQVIKTYKGSSSPGTTIWFSIPVGGFHFGEAGRATVSSPGFNMLENGGRYLVFLRFARGNEEKVTAARRLSGGDGLQGAFELDHELVS